MIRIKVVDKFGAVYYWEKNNSEADMWVEELLAMNEYGLPHEMTVTQTVISENDFLPTMYECAEDIPANTVVDVKHEYGALKIRKVKSVADNTNVDFAGRIVRSCGMGYGAVVVAYTDVVTGMVHLKYGIREGGNMVWLVSASMGEAVPDDICICSFGEGRFLIAMQGVKNYGCVWIGWVGEEEIRLSKPQQFSTNNLCREMSCISLDWMNFIVAYQDGADKLGYYRRCNFNEEEDIWAWDEPACYGITECYENRLSLFGVGNEEQHGFAVFYRRAATVYSGYMQTFLFTEGGEVIPAAEETLCADTYCKGMRPIAVSETQIALAYRDIDMGGYGVVRIGNLEDPSNPIFSNSWTLVVNPNLTTEIDIYCDINTMNSVFTLMWINGTKNRRLEYGIFYFENNIPTANSYGWIVDYYQSISCTHVTFIYEGYADLFLAYVVETGFGEFVTCNYTTSEMGVGFCYHRFADGITAEDGLIGEVIRVNIPGEYNDCPGVNTGQVYYINRRGDLSQMPSPFPMAIAVSQEKLLVTKNPNWGLD